MTALTLGATGVRFSANYASPGDLYALRLMLASQIVAVALTYRFVCRSPASTIACAISVWPFAITAGYVGAESFLTTTYAATWVFTFILLLGVGQSRLRTPSHSIAATFVALVFVGLPLLYYLAAEFSNDSLARFDPIFLIFSAIF
jgi:hypothetical protein